MKKIVLARNASGLGNKMKAIVSAKRLVERDPQNLQLKIFWNHTNGKNTLCPYDFLFENTESLISADEWERLREQGLINREVSTWRILTFKEDNVPPSPITYHEWFQKNRAHTGLLNGQCAQDQLRGTHSPIDGAYNKIPECVIKNILPHFDSFKIRRDILDEVGEFFHLYPQLLNRESFSVILRSWPEINKNHWKSKTFDLNLFFDYINKKEGSFFITGDVPDLVGQVKEKYKDRCVIRPQGYGVPIKPSTDFAHEVVQGFINGLIAARCKEMVISPYSTYPEISWWLEGARARVVQLSPQGIYE